MRDKRKRSKKGKKKKGEKEVGKQDHATKQITTELPSKVNIIELPFVTYTRRTSLENT